ncbi:MAG: hypothetical protein AAF291_09875 [Pseudomonadota bacterium]
MEFLDILKWSASITGMFAAILVALNAGAKVTGWGFVIFSLSSLIWITASAIDGNDPLVAQNLVLLGINLFGIYRYLFRDRSGRSEKGSSEPSS